MPPEASWIWLFDGLDKLILSSLLGGFLGAYITIRSISDSRERAYAVKFLVLALLPVASILATFILILAPFSLTTWIVHGSAVALGMVLLNRVQARIRGEESKQDRQP